MMGNSPAAGDKQYGFYARRGKRMLDLTLAAPAIVLLSPVFVVVSVLVKREMGAPVIFCQKRAGRHGAAFTMLKFRTMTRAVDENNELVPDNLRLTLLGKRLRHLSLDELPELLNVLKGEMSLVGPRPLLMEYLERYSSRQNRRHDIKPGLTGWAQINGRNAISWEQKFELDVWYVEHLSLFLDLKIILITLLKIVRREGINQSRETTMEEFRGADE